MAFSDFASLVKLTHTAFALPFALTSLLVATGGEPDGSLFGLCVLAVLCARTAAMAYNRFVDRDIDARNPRTMGREIPRGAVTARAALWLTLAAAAAFVLVCSQLGPTCLWGSVPVLLWLLGYSHMKRWSSLCHLWLGVALGLSPVAAWVAAHDALGEAVRVPLLAPILLGLGVVVWVAGFDVVYACQDEAFDRQEGLHSIPVRFGIRGSLGIARGMHLAAALQFAAYGRMAGLGWGYGAAVALAVALMVWQHLGLDATKVRRLGPSFFLANGVLSVCVLLGAFLDL